MIREPESRTVLAAIRSREEAAGLRLPGVPAALFTCHIGKWNQDASGFAEQFSGPDVRREHRECRPEGPGVKRRAIAWPTGRAGENGEEVGPKT